MFNDRIPLSPFPSSPQTLSELVLLHLAYGVNIHTDYSPGKQLDSLLFERNIMRSWKTLTIIVLDPSVVASNYARTGLSLLISKECRSTATGNNGFLLIILCFT